MRPVESAREGEEEKNDLDARLRKKEKRKKEEASYVSEKEAFLRAREGESRKGCRPEKSTPLRGTDGRQQLPFYSIGKEKKRGGHGRGEVFLH